MQLNDFELLYTDVSPIVSAADALLRDDESQTGVASQRRGSLTDQAHRVKNEIVWVTLTVTAIWAVFLLVSGASESGFLSQAIAVVVGLSIWVNVVIGSDASDKRSLMG